MNAAAWQREVALYPAVALTRFEWDARQAIPAVLQLRLIARSSRVADLVYTGQVDAVIIVREDDQLIVARPPLIARSPQIIEALVAALTGLPDDDIARLRRDVYRYVTAMRDSLSINMPYGTTQVASAWIALRVREAGPSLTAIAAELADRTRDP